MKNLSSKLNLTETNKMLINIWLKIILVIVLAGAPILFIQSYLLRSSLSLVTSMAQNLVKPEILESQQKLLKIAASRDPEHVTVYKSSFESIQKARVALADFETIKTQLMKDVLSQTFLLAGGILIIFLILAFFVAKTVVNRYERLMKQNLEQTRKLEKMKSLETWQDMAKMIVHEIKGPLMPIKLFSSDVEKKYSLLPKEQYQDYLLQNANLINGEIKKLESMVESFTMFGRLPPVTKKEVCLHDIIKEFVALFQPSLVGKARLCLNEASLKSKMIALDKKLIHQIFSNLISNAIEANPNTEVPITIAAQEDNQHVTIHFQNYGNLIPKNLVDKIFDLYVSTKSEKKRLNMGLGLTICKKIALDHGGDLFVATNDDKHGVTFLLKLPL